MHRNLQQQRIFDIENQRKLHRSPPPNMSLTSNERRVMYVIAALVAIALCVVVSGVTVDDLHDVSAEVWDWGFGGSDDDDDGAFTTYLRSHA